MLYGSPGQGRGSSVLLEVPGRWWRGLIGMMVAQECGVRFWRFLGSWLQKVFVVVCGDCMMCEGEMLGGSGRWLFQEFAGEVWVADRGCGK